MGCNHSTHIHPPEKYPTMSDCYTSPSPHRRRNHNDNDGPTARELQTVLDTIVAAIESLRPRQPQAHLPGAECRRYCGHRKSTRPHVAHYYDWRGISRGRQDEREDGRGR